MGHGHRRRQGDAGFGLVEALVSLLVLAIVVLPVTRIVVTTLNASDTFHLRAEAGDLATQTLETAEYQTASGVVPTAGTSSATRYSGTDPFTVTTAYSLVAGTSAASNLCTAGSGQATSPVWSLSATVAWGSGAGAGHVTETTLISPTAADLANVDAAEIAVPVYNADDATLETTAPITLDAVGTCTLGAGKCGTVPAGETTTPAAASTGSIGCAVFADLYAGTGMTYTVTAQGNLPYVDPNELSAETSSPGLPTRTGVAVQPDNVTVVDNPDLILAVGASVQVGFQTVAFGSASAASPTSTAISTSCTSACSSTTAVTWTATVSPSSATGTVSFTDGGTAVTCGSGSVTTLPGSGADEATCKVTGPSAGKVVATYGGSSGLAGSSATLYQTTSASVTDSSTSLTVSQTPSLEGRTVTFTATVSPSSATGTVSFTDDGTAISCGTGSSTTLSGTGADVATCVDTITTSGSRDIAASYAGTAPVQASAASITQLVDATSSVAPAAYVPISVQSPTLLCSTLAAEICVLPNLASASGLSSTSPQTALLFPGPSTTPNYSAWAGDQADSEPFYVDGSGTADYPGDVATSFTADSGSSLSVTLPLYPLSLKVTGSPTTLTATDAAGGDAIGLNPVASGTSATGLPLGQFALGATTTSGAASVSPAYVWITPSEQCSSSQPMLTPSNGSCSTSPIAVTVG